MYRCGACGNELFSSETKFDSGSGWPSFTEPAMADASSCTPTRPRHDRAEVVCAAVRRAPRATSFTTARRRTGQRYCINSIALDLDESEA